MKIKELINHLKYYPEDLEVKVNSGYWACAADIFSVIPAMKKDIVHIEIDLVRI